MRRGRACCYGQPVAVRASAWYTHCTDRYLVWRTASNRAAGGVASRGDTLLPEGCLPPALLPITPYPLCCHVVLPTPLSRQVAKCVAHIASLGAEGTEREYGLPNRHTAEALFNRSRGKPRGEGSAVGRDGTWPGPWEGRFS